MALFESGNPTLTEKIFNSAATRNAAIQGTMSVRGTMNKFGFMLLMLMGAATYTWNLYQTGNPGQMQTLMMVGIFGGMIAAFAIIFKPTWAPFIAPAYGLLEGFFIGGLSAVMNDMFQKSYPGLVMQAVGLTFGVAIAMFLLYNFRVIRATEKFKSIIFSATLGIAIFYGLTMLLRLFGVQIDFISVGNNSTLAIGISLFVVAIAALNLIMDFDMIEKGAESGAPKFMEWYGAFGLMVTIVWLYIEILKLLSRFAKRN